MNFERYHFLGLPIDDCLMEEAVRQGVRLARGKDPSLILFLNTDVIVKASKYSPLKNAIENSALSLMDGMAPLRLARALGIPLKEKVSGSDYVPLLLSQASKNGLSVFILGGDETASFAAVKNVIADYPGLSEVLSFSPPFGFELDAEAIADAVLRVRSASPDILLLCLGCPKQEIIANELLDLFSVPCVVCAGATVDFLAGTVKRAPKWVSAIGIEWLYRFAKEPRRLFKRYFVDSWKIAPLIARDCTERLFDRPSEKRSTAA